MLWIAAIQNDWISYMLNVKWHNEKLSDIVLGQLNTEAQLHVE